VVPPPFSKMLLANSITLFTPPFVKGGLGGISDVGIPVGKKIPPDPPLKKGGERGEEESE